MEWIKKLQSKRGSLTRAAGILLFLICILSGILFLVPGWSGIRGAIERFGCAEAMKTAKDGLIIEYLGSFDEGTPEEARKAIASFMPAREDICPSGGNVYLIPREDGIYETFCGVHGRDEKQRTRLNASYALEKLQEKLRRERRLSDKEPDKVSIVVNSKDLDCIRVKEEVPIRRGTSLTMGYEGVVSFYRIREEDGTPGEIDYYLYADELHCAVWRESDGWSGDSYEQGTP